MPPARRHALFATCAPGIEPVLHAELSALRFAKVERQVGGCYFEGTLSDVWRANLWLRTAVRVLVRVARFEAGDEDALYRGARGVDWSPWLRPAGTLAVTAHAGRSRIFHTGYIAQLVKDAICDRSRELHGVRPSVEKTEPELAVNAHVVKDRCTLAVDSSGASLHKRGWRRHQGRAPLAETLAAALLAFARWDRRSPLLDPFCGSGTIPIEAALLARGRAPGLFRARFGFERWPCHEPDAWERLRSLAREADGPRKKLLVFGSDADPEHVAGARENAAAAGVEGDVTLEVADARAFAPRRGWNGWIVTNPPYGERVGDKEELAAVYAAFGARLREHAAGYRIACLTGDPRLAARLGLESPARVALRNGALSCELLLAPAEATSDV